MKESSLVVAPEALNFNVGYFIFSLWLYNLVFHLSCLNCIVYCVTNYPEIFN